MRELAFIAIPPQVRYPLAIRSYRRDRVMRSITILVTTIAVSLTGFAADPEPFSGTWKLNLSKSKFGSLPRPQSGIVRFEPQTSGVLLVYRELTTAAGKSETETIPIRWDGRDYPVAHAGGTTISRTRPNPNTIVGIMRREGKVAARVKWLVSPDGRTATSISTAPVRNGESFTTEFVYDRE
jgi:hypothetical protein